MNTNKKTGTSGPFRLQFYNFDCNDSLIWRSLVSVTSSLHEFRWARLGHIPGDQEAESESEERIN